MRFVIFLFLTLFLGGWILTQLPHEGGRLPAASPWRRTATGWENVEDWRRSAVPPYRISPLVVAALQMGISLVALVAAHEARKPAGAHGLDAISTSIGDPSATAIASRMDG